MVKISLGGNYIKAKNVKDGDVVLFLDEGRIEVSDKFKYPDGNFQKSFVVTVDYNGEKKSLKINGKSKTALVNAWGDETQNWIGKKATMFTVPTDNGQSMIVLKPIKGDFEDVEFAE